MKRQPTITDIIMLAGGAITFLFSFLTFWDVPEGLDDSNAWGSFAFPTFTIPAILGLAMVVLILVDWFAAPAMPKVLTFDWKQIYVTWGVVAVVIVLSAFVLSDGPDTGIGTIFMLLGSAAMAVGAILNILGVATEPLGGVRTAAPGGYPGTYPGQPGVQGGNYPPQPGQYGQPGQPGYSQPPPQGYPPQTPPPPPGGGPGVPPPPPPA